MKPIQPQERDGIPREVASAMLTEPRARLTNRMRKNGMAAREKVFASVAPFRRMPAQDAAGKIIKGYGYAEIESRSLEDKTKQRLSRASIRQLGNWLHRSIARRVVVQRKYLAVPNSDVRAFQAKFDAARQALALLAERLDIIRDVCEDEIVTRKAKCDSIVGIRIGFSSTVRFYRTAGL